MSRTAPFIARSVVCSFALLTAAAVAAPPATAPSFTVVDDTWHDAVRNRDVPVRLYLPADASKPAATIVSSHGLGDSRAAMAFACEAWAARGFVVAAVQHPGSDDAIWRDALPGDRFGAIFRAATAEQFLARCADVKFALDELTRRNAEPGPLAGRVDTNRFGVAGHSFGALTAQAIIGERYAPLPGGNPVLSDDRIKAAVLMSPGIEGVVDASTAFASVHIPVFHFTGTADVVTGLGATPASKRRLPYDRMTASDQFLITFARGDHMVFSGHRPAGINDARYDRIQAATATLSADFFEAYLGDGASAKATILRDAAALGDEAKFEHKSTAAATHPSS